MMDNARMALPAIQDLPPEILEGFFGKAPLKSIRHCYRSRRELLQAYAQAQGSYFGTATVKADACDLCGTSGAPGAWLHISWSARVRFRIGGLTLLILSFPVIIALAFLHLE
jgi:hypothetical protein